MIKKPGAKIRAKNKEQKAVRNKPQRHAVKNTQSNPELAARLAQLGLNPIALGEIAIPIFQELDRKHRKPGEVGLLFHEAKRSLVAALFASDDPEDWNRAAREAAGLGLGGLRH